MNLSFVHYEHKPFKTLKDAITYLHVYMYRY